MPGTPRVFGYWFGDPGPHGRAFPADCHDAWRDFDPAFAIFDDAAVLRALAPWPQSIRDLYLDIRLPACRSDVARLALLHAFGGTYIDAHTEPGDPVRLRSYVQTGTRHALTVAQIDPQQSRRPYDRIFNSPISARPGEGVTIDLLRRAFANLAHHRDIERRSRSPGGGSIFDLTGPNMIRDKLIDYSGPVPAIFAAYRTIVRFVTLHKAGDGPFRLYWHCGYRVGNAHWAMRERVEPLFFSTG